MGGGRFDHARLSLLMVACGMALLPSLASAQSQGVISGIVIDSAGAAVFGAEVTVTGTAYRAVTDERGFFQLGVPIGSVPVSIRRMGFTPYTKSFTINDANSRIEDIRVVLSPLPTVLMPVLVSSRKVD